MRTSDYKFLRERDYLQSARRKGRMHRIFSEKKWQILFISFSASLITARMFFPEAIYEGAFMLVLFLMIIVGIPVALVFEKIMELTLSWQGLLHSMINLFKKDQFKKLEQKLIHQIVKEIRIKPDLNNNHKQYIQKVLNRILKKKDIVFHEKLIEIKALIQDNEVEFVTQDSKLHFYEIIGIVRNLYRIKI